MPHTAQPSLASVPTPATPAPVGVAAESNAADAARVAVRRAEDQAERLRQAVARIGQEVAGPLTEALERLLDFGQTGKLDRAGLRAIRQAVEQARQAGMISQQLARLVAGVGQAPERLHLTHTLQNVLAHRSRELHARGVQIVQQLDPVEVVVDPALLFALLNGVLDWAVGATLGPVQLRVDRQAWPSHGRLACRFACMPADRAAHPAAPAALDSLLWRLVDESARALGLVIERRLDGAHAVLELVFPRTIDPLLEAAEDAAVATRPGTDAPGGASRSAASAEPQAAEAPDTASGFISSLNSKPLAGSHVLVVASRRERRVQIREAIRDMGLVVDFVTSVEECADFCRESLPHAIVVESVLKGPKLEQLMRDIRAEVPEFVFIEVEEEGSLFQISSVSPTGCARVGRDALASSLPSALVYELTRVM